MAKDSDSLYCPNGTLNATDGSTLENAGNGQLYHQYVYGAAYVNDGQGWDFYKTTKTYAYTTDSNWKVYGVNTKTLNSAASCIAFTDATSNGSSLAYVTFRSRSGAGEFTEIHGKGGSLGFFDGHAAIQSGKWLKGTAIWMTMPTVELFPVTLLPVV